jgi:2C-methyl-D-erythritol 2,4-cyclodiphosphate synthase
MKRFLSILGLAGLFLVFCGAPQGPGTETKGPTVQAEEAIAYGILTDAEIQHFLKAVPVFRAETEKKQAEWEALDSPEHLGSWLGQFSKMNKDIADLDAKLTAAGMPWKDFWPAMAKTMTAFVAVMYDSTMAAMKKEAASKEGDIAKMQAKLNDPKVSAQEKEMIKASLEMIKSMQGMVNQAETLYARVPQVNKDMIKKYQADLIKVFEMND